MPNDVRKALACLHHSPPIKIQSSFYSYNDTGYDQKFQYIIPITANKKLTPDQLKHCQ